MNVNTPSVTVLAKTLINLVDRNCREPPASWCRRAAALFVAGGEYWLEVLLLQEIMADFDAQAGRADPQSRASHELRQQSSWANAATTADNYYSMAAALWPESAEAYYGLGRLAVHRGDHVAAYKAFDQAGQLTPHPELPVHAYLKENANWECAELKYAEGNLNSALRSYQRALEGLGNFGPAHLHYATLLRRVGRLEEAAANYNLLMQYSHRYAPEFILPVVERPIPLPRRPDGSPVDLLAMTPIKLQADGSRIAFHAGLYFSIPPSWPDELDATEIRSRASRRFVQLFSRTDRIRCATELESLSV